MHIWFQRYSNDPKKRIANLKKHGYDFKDAPQMIENPASVTFEDRRIAYEEQRFITPGLLCGQVVVFTTAETEEEIRVISMRKADRKKKSTMPTFDEDAPISQVDIDTGRLVLRKRFAGRAVPPKKRVTFYLDDVGVEHFKDMAGDRGYQTLINETPKSSLRNTDIAETLRQVIREEFNSCKAA